MTFAWEVTITVKDEANHAGLLRMWVEYHDEDVPAFSSFANVESNVNNILPFIDNMISGVIENVSISRNIDLPGGLKSTAGSTSDVEEKGVFVFRTSFGNTRISLPTFKDSLVVSGTDEIDTSDTDVAAFIFRVIDGSSTPWEFVRGADYRDEPIISFVDAYEKFKRRAH